MIVGRALNLESKPSKKKQREKLIYLDGELFLLDLCEQQGELIICDSYRYQYFPTIATAIVGRAINLESKPFKKKQREKLIYLVGELFLLDLCEQQGELSLFLALKGDSEKITVTFC